eukprot:495452-Hanusia_phi.AAC.1
MLASPDDERSLTEHEDIAEEVEEQFFSSPPLEERQVIRMTDDFMEAPSTPFSNDREIVLKASEGQEHQRLL